MAEDITPLIIKLQADIASLKSQLAEGQRSIQDFGRVAEDIGSKVRGALAFAGVAIGIFEIASALKSFSESAAMVGARTESLSVAMTTIGKNAGVSSDSLEYFTKQVRAAGITTQESMSAITTFMTSGLPLDKLKELATRARDVAVVAGKNTSDTLNHIIHGMVSGQSEMLRTVHIQIRNADDIYKSYAQTLGKTKEELNSVEKAHAMLNEVLRASERFAGAAAAADETVGKQLFSMQRYAMEAKEALWGLFGPIMTSAVKEQITLWQDLKKWADENQMALRTWGREVGEVIAKVVEFTKVNKELLITLGELAVLYKVVSFFGKLGMAITAATISAQALLTTIVAISGALGVLGGIKTFTSPGGFEGNAGEINPFWMLGAEEGGGRPRGPMSPIDRSRATGILGQSSAERAAREAQDAVEQALRNAPGSAGKGGGKAGGGGAEKSRLAEWTEELERLKMAEKDFADYSKEKEKEFWRSKLTLCEEGSREYQQIYHRIYAVTKEIVRERIKEEERAKKEAVDIKHEELNQTREIALIEIEMDRERVRQKRAEQKLTAQQELAELRILKEREHQIELKALEDWKELNKEKPKELAKVNRQIEVNKKRHDLDLLKLETTNQSKIAQGWDQAFGAVKSGVSSLLEAVISGTADIAAVFLGIAKSILDVFVNIFVQIIGEWIKNLLIGKGTTAITNASIIASDAARGAAAAYASTAAIPIIGPALAPAAAAQALASIMAFVPLAAARGGWDVPHDALAYIHAREMVLPASLADKVRNMSDDGGASNIAVTVNVSALDGQSISSLRWDRIVKKHIGPAIAKQVGRRA